VEDRECHPSPPSVLFFGRFALRFLLIAFYFGLLIVPCFFWLVQSAMPPVPPLISAGAVVPSLGTGLVFPFGAVSVVVCGSHSPPAPQPLVTGPTFFPIPPGALPLLYRNSSFRRPPTSRSLRDAFFLFLSQPWFSHPSPCEPHDEPR